MAFSSTSPSVIETVPTVATTSAAVCCLAAGCAAVEHAMNSSGTASARRFTIMRLMGVSIPWLVARGSWLVARGVARRRDFNGRNDREAEIPSDLGDALRKAWRKVCYDHMQCTIVKVYRDLDAWQAAMALVERHGLLGRFPRHELRTDCQLRRRLPSNIAEALPPGVVNHVSIALGSHAEVETCFEIAMRLGYLQRDDTNKVASSIERTGQLLNGLLRSR